MTDVRIAIIVGSTRPGRQARAVADWVLEQASTRPGARYEIVDLADHPLPHLDEPMPPSLGQYQHDHTAWAATIGAYDGFIFVTPEYNHSTSGVSRTPSTTSTPSGTTRRPPSSPTVHLAVRGQSSICAQCVAD